MTSPHDIDVTAREPGVAAHAAATLPAAAPGIGAVPWSEGAPVDQQAAPEMDLQQLTALAPLEPGVLEVYEHAARTMSISPSELVRLTGRSQDDVANSVRILLRLRLLRPAQGDPAKLTVVSPDSAELHVLMPAARKVAELQEALSHLRGEISALSDRYHDGVMHRLREESTEVVTGLGNLRACVDTLVANASRQLLVSQPGGGQGALWEPAQRTQAALARGLQLRSLYQHTAQFSPATVAHVEQLTDLGAQVRTLGDQFGRAMVIDHDTAVIPLRGDPCGVVIIRESSTVDFMASTFERLWGQATPFPAKLGRRQAVAASNAMKSDIVRLLITGEDDKAIARRMGMSVRTCQRHINEIMKRLGARNRTHGGYLLRQFETDSAGSDSEHDASAPSQVPQAPGI
ncbi:LuxR C-terminal-related transcriptional regulator [Streptomyces netropsis]